MEAQTTMPKDVFARVIRWDMNNPWCQQAIQWWSRIQDRNHFDPDVLTYPNTAVIQAYEKQTGRPLLYMPVHKVYMMEALGPNPDANGFEIASSLAQIVKALAWDAPKDGVGELYFPCTDENVNGFCTDHGFNRMLYQSGTTQLPRPEGATDDPKPEPVMADMPHWKFKVFKDGVQRV